MTERLPTTNLLLLLLLTGFLLVTGSLQCAFACLTQADSGYRSTKQVSSCHLIENQPAPALNCPNKACHKVSPQHQDLGGPQLFSLNKLQHPLSSTSRLQMPLLRVGTPLTLPAPQPILLAVQSNDLSELSQQLRSLRSTVLLN